MSIAVELQDLATRVSEYGPAAFLVTVGDRGPHVVSVGVRLADGMLVAAAGRTTAGNAAKHSDVTLLWPAPDDGDYCLVVDGSASISGEVPDAQISVEPARAVLHRLSDAAGDGPSCVRILDRRDS